MNRLSAARKTPSGSAVGVFVMKKLVIPVCLARVTRARVHRSVVKPAARGPAGGSGCGPNWRLRWTGLWPTCWARAIPCLISGSLSCRPQGLTYPGFPKTLSIQTRPWCSRPSGMWCRRAWASPGPARWTLFRPRASSLSVLLVMPSMSLVLAACTCLGTQPACSISSTNQNQFPHGFHSYWTSWGASFVEKGCQSSDS